MTIDLDAVKAYAMENAELMQAATSELVDVAQEYYDHVQQASGDNADPYAKLWAENQAEIHELVVQARDLWL